MKTMRTTILGFLATVLFALALPASAADKVFSFSATIYNSAGAGQPYVVGGVVSASASNPSVVLLDTFNRTPNEFNSVFKSVRDTLGATVVWSIITDKTVNGPTSSCGTTPPALPPSINWSSGPITRNGLQGVKPSGHYCLWVAAYDTAPGSVCALETWSGQANTGTNFGGGTAFTDFLNPGSEFSFAFTGSGACTGVLGCDATNNRAGNLHPDHDVEPVGAPDWGLIRGNNKDGGACIVVPYQFTLDTVNNRASFIVPSGTGQKVAVKYVVRWSAVASDTGDPNAGWTSKRPLFSWGIINPDPTPGSGHYIPALACAQEDPPSFASLTPAELLALLPIIPDIPLFQGNPNYPVLTTAKMCVLQHGWTAVGPNLYQYLTKTADEADGFMSLD
jgi:hypothetical protein